METNMKYIIMAVILMAACSKPTERVTPSIYVVHGADSAKSNAFTAIDIGEIESIEFAEVAWDTVTCEYRIQSDSGLNISDNMLYTGTIGNGKPRGRGKAYIKLPSTEKDGKAQYAEYDIEW